MLVYVKYLTLVEYAVTLASNLFSAQTFFSLLRGQFDKQSGGQQSPFLVLYLIVWLSTITTSLPFLVYMLVQWRPYDGNITLLSGDEIKRILNSKF